MRVGIFDSGLGGITILKSLLENKPNNEYIYYGDTLNLPYGNKSKEELLSISDNIIKFLINEKVDVILIACGTLSSNVYDEIKNNYDVKLVDIITPIVEELKVMELEKVGLLGTKMTIMSGTFKRKIEEIGLKVVDQACPQFVEIIEKRSNESIDYYIDKYLSGMKNKNLELIIPGCTHYTIIKDEITKYLGVPVMDIGKVISDYLALEDTKHSVKCYFSLLDEEVIRSVKEIIGDHEIIEKRIDW